MGSPPVWGGSDEIWPDYTLLGRLNQRFLNIHTAVVTALLDAGANLHARQIDGDTPLHNAAAGNTNPDIIRVLLDAGTDLEAPNKSGLTPLHRAAQHNTNPAVVETLLDAGANPLAHDTTGRDLSLRENPDKIPWDYAKENEALKGSNAYWRLHDAQY